MAAAVVAEAAAVAGPLANKRARIGFGIANLAVALFIAFGVFRLLPTRWWVVDTGAVIMTVLLAASGITLLRQHRLAERLTRAAAGVVLVLGLFLFAAIALTASWISGVYGQVGAGGAIIFGLVAALVLPYVVVLPAVELAWIGARPRTVPPPPVGKKPAEKEATIDRGDDDDDDDGDGDGEGEKSDE